MNRNGTLKTSWPSAPAQGSLYARIVGVVVAVGLWLAINALLWYCLIELPPFKSLPPVLVGVAGIFANFYLIPLARRVGARSRRRMEEARAGSAPWPT
jgi:urea transporter